MKEGRNKMINDLFVKDPFLFWTVLILGVNLVFFAGGKVLESIMNFKSK